MAVEEDYVEVESHPEGVNAAAAGNQQAQPRLIAGQPGESEQATERIHRDRDRAAADTIPGQPAQAWGEHALSRSRPYRPLPPTGPIDLDLGDSSQGANGRSATASNRHPRTMIGKIMDLLPLGLWGQMGFNSHG